MDKNGRRDLLIKVAFFTFFRSFLSFLPAVLHAFSFLLLGTVILHHISIHNTTRDTARFRAEWMTLTRGMKEEEDDIHSLLNVVQSLLE